MGWGAPDLDFSSSGLDAWPQAHPATLTGNGAHPTLASSVMIHRPRAFTRFKIPEFSVIPAKQIVDKLNTEITNIRHEQPDVRLCDLAHLRALEKASIFSLGEE
jgi:hypothetical protein